MYLRVHDHRFSAKHWYQLFHLSAYQASSQANYLPIYPYPAHLSRYLTHHQRHKRLRGGAVPMTIEVTTIRQEPFHSLRPSHQGVTRSAHHTFRHY